MAYETDYEIPTTVTLSETLSQLPTTSAKIRFLSQNGYTRYKISQVLGIRYQHVRNVLITPVSKPRA